MARSINKWIAIGNFVRDPEYRTFANGGGVCNFSIAVNNPKKNASTGQWEDEPAFIDCNAWDRGENKMGSRIAESFKKGMRILVEAHVTMEMWDDKTTGQKRSKLKMVVDSFFFIDRKDDTPRGQTSQSSGYSQSGGDYDPPQDNNPQAVGDEIPF